MLVFLLMMTFYHGILVEKYSLGFDLNFLPGCNKCANFDFLEGGAFFSFSHDIFLWGSAFLDNS